MRLKGVAQTEREITDQRQPEDIAAAQACGMRLHALVFNAFPEGDPVVRQDAEAYFRQVLARDWPDADFLNLPILSAC